MPKHSHDAISRGTSNYHSKRKRKHDKPIRKTTKGKGKHYLPTKQGAGMTAKGRKAYNAKNGSNLNAPQAKGSRHKSFCARSRGWTGERGRAARRRWHC